MSINSRLILFTACDFSTAANDISASSASICSRVAFNSSFKPTTIGSSTSSSPPFTPPTFSPMLASDAVAVAVASACCNSFCCCCCCSAAISCNKSTSCFSWSTSVCSVSDLKRAEPASVSAAVNASLSLAFCSPAVAVDSASSLLASSCSALHRFTSAFI